MVAYVNIIFCNCKQETDAYIAVKACILIYVYYRMRGCTIDNKLMRNGDTVKHTCYYIITQRTINIRILSLSSLPE